MVNNVQNALTAIDILALENLQRLTDSVMHGGVGLCVANI